MDIEMKRARQQQKLSERLKLTAEEDLAALLTRTLPTLEAVDPRSKTAFVMHYGFEGHDPTILRDIGDSLDVGMEAARHLIEKSVGILKEVHATMRTEREALGDYRSWSYSDFFTQERGVLARVDSTTVVHIQRQMEIECRQRIPANIGEFLDERHEARIRRGRGWGPVSVEGLKAMLATADLVLNPDGI